MKNFAKTCCLLALGVVSLGLTLTLLSQPSMGNGIRVRTWNADDPPSAVKQLLEANKGLTPMSATAIPGRVGKESFNKKLGAKSKKFPGVDFFGSDGQLLGSAKVKPKKEPGEKKNLFPKTRKKKSANGNVLKPKGATKLKKDGKVVDGMVSGAS